MKILLNFTTELQNHRTSRQNSADRYIYVFGGCKENQCPSDQINKFDLKNEFWSSNGRLNGVRRDFEVVQDGTNIYLLGGSNGIRRMNLVEAYNPLNNDLVRKSSMNSAREYLCIVFLIS